MPVNDRLVPESVPAEHKQTARALERTSILSCVSAVVQIKMLSKAVVMEVVQLL